MKKAIPRRILRVVLAALAVLVLAGWIVPSFLSFEHYRRFLRNGLEADLGRRVTFGSLSFHLLPRPEFIIRNVLIAEDPRFGIEPFARIGRVDCTLRWTSLWSGRLILSGLDLEGPSFNVVQAGGAWNVESLLPRRGYSTSPARPSRVLRLPGLLEVDVEDGRINFKTGGVKRPLIVDDVKGQFFSSPASRSLRFNFAGTPSRTDLMVPSPGPVEISGVWSPGPGRPHPLTATVRLRNSLLFSWLPLITGHNPEIYGLMGGDIAVEGTFDRLQAQGSLEMTQVHRWESLPPIRPLPITLQFELSADRNRHQVFISPVDVTFASAHLHLTGSLRLADPSPGLDLVLAVQRSPVEDLMRMASQLSGRAVPSVIAGELNGLLTVRGTRGDEQCAGFFGARHLMLRTRAGNFPVAPAAIRIDQNAARLMPVRIKLAPHFSLMAEGYWGPETGGTSISLRPRPHLQGQSQNVKPSKTPAARIYRVTLSSNSAPLREVVQLARGLGIAFARRLDLTGLANGRVILQGSGWPLSRPVATGRLEVINAQLAAPGLTEPLEFPDAQIRVNGDDIVANPVTLVIGENKFTGSLDHRGAQRDPWAFSAHCDRLAIEQAAQWFEALGFRQPSSLLARIPGLASLAARLQAGRDILGTLNAEGIFQANSLTYRHVSLSDFQSEVQISGRTVRVSNAEFRVAGGQGQGAALVDLRPLPAHVTAQARLTRVHLAALAPHFPSALSGIRGFVSAAGDFTMRGLSRREMSASLDGHARVELRNVTLGSFDPVQASATAMNWGRLVPVRTKPSLRFATFNFLFRNGEAVVSSAPLSLGGAKFAIGGLIQPGGQLNLTLSADLSNMARRRLETGKEEEDPKTAVAEFNVSGPYFSPIIRRAPDALESGR